MGQKSVQVSVIEISNSKSKFEILLQSEHLKRKIHFVGKIIQLKYLEDKKDFIVGLMVTTNRDGIPPKHDPDSDVYSPLDLDENEGLAYANVFLFDKATGVLLYEFNKNGVYIQRFCDFVSRAAKPEESGEPVNITPEALLNIEAYKRMLNMTYFKSIEIQIAQPSSLIEEFKGKNSSLKKVVELGKEINANFITLKFDVKQRRHVGLIDSVLKQIANSLQNIVTRSNSSGDVKKVEITGYEPDPDEGTDSSRKSVVDLVLDRYKAYITIDEKRILKDLQVSDRKAAIVSLYNENVGEFRKILKVKPGGSKKTK